MNWWADTWQAVVDGTPFVDVSQRRSGRNLYRRTEIDLELLPGSATGRFEARRGADPATATISFVPIPDDGWQQLVRAIAARPALTAGVLTGKFPAALDDAARASNVALSPRQGEITSVCSCDTWEEPCLHVWAVLHSVVDAVDADPFTVLIALGRSRQELLGDLRTVRAGGEPGQAQPEGSLAPRGLDPGMGYDEAWSRSPQSRPPSRPLPRRPGQPIELHPEPPLDSGVLSGDLRAVVADAAERATAVLLAAGNAGLHLSPEADLIRRTASIDLGSPQGARQPAGAPARLLGAFAERARMSTTELLAAIRAWQVGGEQGLWVHQSRWEPPEHLLDQAVQALAELGDDSPIRLSGNHVTSRGRQLRLDQDGLWWRFEADAELGWLLATEGFPDPAETLEADAGGQSAGPAQRNLSV